MSDTFENMDRDFWAAPKDLPVSAQQGYTPKERVKTAVAGFTIVGLVALAGVAYGKFIDEKSLFDNSATVASTRPVPTVKKAVPPPYHSHGAVDGSTYPVFTPEDWHQLEAAGWKFYGNRMAETQEDLDKVNAEIAELQTHRENVRVEIGAIFDEQSQEPMDGQAAADYYASHPGAPHLEGIYIWNGYPA